MEARPEDAAVDPTTADLLFSAWSSVLAARRRLADGALGEAAQRAYRVMLRATQALAWETHRLRFRVPAAAHAALWERFARPGAGAVDPELHGWLLAAYALGGRNGTVPPPPLTREAVGQAVRHARAFLEAVHRHLGRRPPFPPEATTG